MTENETKANLFSIWTRQTREGWRSCLKTGKAMSDLEAIQQACNELKIERTSQIGLWYGEWQEQVLGYTRIEPPNLDPMVDLLLEQIKKLLGDFGTDAPYGAIFVISLRKATDKLEQELQEYFEALDLE